MTILQNHIGGPWEEGLERASRSSFGLAATVYTRNPAYDAAMRPATVHVAAP